MMRSTLRRASRTSTERGPRSIGRGEEGDHIHQEATPPIDLGLGLGAAIGGAILAESNRCGLTARRKILHSSMAVKQVLALPNTKHRY